MSKWHWQKGVHLSTCFPAYLFTCLLASSLLVSLFAFLTAPDGLLVLDIRTAGGSVLNCLPVAAGDEIIYQSRNSIYDVPVEEYWRIEPDGALIVAQVISTPAVMGYYGIESYSALANGLTRAVPAHSRYTEIMMKVGPRGQQRLSVSGHVITLYDRVDDGALISIVVHPSSRLAAASCVF